MEYIVSEKHLREFIAAKAKLEALEAGGVDNWMWNSDAIEDYVNEYFDYDEKEHTIEDIIENELKNFKEVDSNAKK